MRKGRALQIFFLTCLLVISLAFPMQAAGVGVRVKDITKIQGVRDNQLLGYGIVVGLQGTGDSNKATFTVQSIASMLKNFGVNVSADEMKLKNVAAVMVTAELPPFAKSGDTIDVTVSSLGDAKNLQGGTLLFTPLKATNGQVYAAAQGPLSIGGFSAGQNNNAVQKNHLTVGRIPNGATVEQEVPTAFDSGGYITWSLNQADFTTASRIANQINQRFGMPGLAEALNAGTVKVKIPVYYKSKPVEFIALVEGINVMPDMVAKIVINERTGTVIMGGEVKLSPIAISHGSLQVNIKEAQFVSQPAPFSQGKTTVIKDTDVQATEEKATNMIFPKGASVKDLVDALNAVGATPRDIIAIVQAIKQAGALQAELEIM